jgi:curved DNA-binding protein CbpA
MNNYYAVLGLNPGADLTAVQKAFRERIKLCHPDKASGPQSAETARQLIEAYNYLKESGNAGNDVVVEYTAGGSTVYTAGSGSTRFYTTHTGEKKEARSTGEDFFKDIFGKKASVYINRFRHGSGHTPYQSSVNGSANKARQTHAAHATQQDPRTYTNARSEQPTPDIFEGASETAKKNYMIAEDLLREVVQKYTRQNERPRRQWARDYIRDLNLVQIRFRTVATQNPSIYRGAMTRLRQIQDLGLEIRKFLQ